MVTRGHTRTGGTEKGGRGRPAATAGDAGPGTSGAPSPVSEGGAAPAPGNGRGAGPDDDAAGQVAATSLGGRIRRRRHDQGLRLVDLAERTDLSVSFLSQMERGLTEPSMRSLIRIADALGITPHALMDGTPPSAKRWSITRAGTMPTVPNDSGTARTMIEANPAVAAVDFVGGPLRYFTYYTLPHDNVILVLSGRYELDVEGAISTLKAGDAAFVQQGVPHRWRRLGGPKSRLISVIRETGGGTESGRRPPGT